MPEYFQFYVQDPEDIDYWELGVGGEAQERRFSHSRKIIAVVVVSEYSPITIDASYYRTEPPKDDGKWDLIRQVSLMTDSGKIVVCSCPDGPEYGQLDEFYVSPGEYQVRIYYGGQDTVKPDSASEDFYKVEIWPCSEHGT